MSNSKYLFIRLDEEGANVKLTDNLDEFKDFCHYAILSDWAKHKEIILKAIDKCSTYIFNGNDVWYYVLSHNVWDICDFKDLKLNKD